MDGVSDLGRGQPGLPRDGAAGVGRPHAHDALGVVAVGAALEERESAVGEPAHAVQRGLRDGGQLGQTRRRRRQQREVPAGEELELAVGGRRLGSGGGLRFLAVAVDADEQARAVALELDRAVAGRLQLVRLEPAEHPADRRPSVGLPARVDGAGDDQAVHRRASWRRSRGAAAPPGPPPARRRAPRRRRRRRGASRSRGRRRGSRSARLAGTGSRPARAPRGRGRRRPRSRP